MSDSPPVSIIVTLVDGPAQALRCFGGIAAQGDDPPFEVVVVDNASTGLAPLLARLQGDVELVRSERRIGFSSAVALGLERARGQYVAIVRGAAEPAPGWLSPLIRALDDPSVAIATSVTDDAPEGHPLAAWAFALRAADARAADRADVPDHLFAAALGLRLAEHGRRTVALPGSRVFAPGMRSASARRPPGETPELSIVIPTLDATSARVRMCVAAVQSTTDVAHEIVLVDNGSSPQGFTAPVNTGIRGTRTPYVVVMNDDVEPLDGWWEPLRMVLDGGAAVTFPLTVDGLMRRDFAAWCFAMTRDSVARFSHTPDDFFDPTLVVWYQDTDLLLRLRAAGRPPVLVESSRIRHGLSQSVNTEDPELNAWIRTRVTADRRYFLRKHPDAALNGVLPAA